MSNQALPQDLNIVAMYAALEENEGFMEEGSSIETIEPIASKDQQQHQVEKSKGAIVIKQETSEEDNTDGPIAIKLEDSEKDNIDAAIAQSQQKQDTNNGYESSDLSSSDDDGDDDDDDENIDDDDDDEEEDDVDDEGNKESTGPLRTQHELVNVLIDAVNFEIIPTTELIPIGAIQEIIDNVIVVHSYPDMANTVLDMGTLFAFEDRTAMGEVFETFGPVSRPYYSVRFNSSDEIDKKKAIVGAPVSYVPIYERTKLVPVEELKKKTYTDASNAFDEEISEGDIEFSDDEKELAHKQSKKKKRSRAKPAGNSTLQAPGVIPDDFDSALAAYEQTVTPRRQLQSYADISEEPDTSYMVPEQFKRPPGVPAPQYATADTPWYMGKSLDFDVQQQQRRRKNKGKGRGKPQADSNSQQHWSQQPHVTQQIAQQSTYQSPADLVTSLLKSYGGDIPNLSASGQQSAANTTQSSNNGSSVRSIFSTPPPSSKDA